MMPVAAAAVLAGPAPGEVATASSGASSSAADSNRQSMASTATSKSSRSLGGTTNTNRSAASTPARSSGVPVACASSEEGSNRSSTVSEYQGEEVNIRITTNPRAEEVNWDYKAMGLDYDELMDYFDNLKESVA